MNDAKTLLIDGDLRRPRLAKVFEISEDHPSLLEWLSSDDKSLDFAHLVNSDVHKNLDEFIGINRNRMFEGHLFFDCDIGCLQ